MAIRFRCSGCSRLLSAKDEHAGRKAKCPACGQLNLIPGVSRETPSAPPSDAGGVRFCEVPCGCGRVLKLTTEQLERGVICAQCGRRVPEPEAPEPGVPPPKPPEEEAPQLPRGFVATLRDGLSYPFRGKGLIAILILAAITIAASIIGSILSFFPCIGVILAMALNVMVYGYASSYFLSVVAASARGEHGPPDLPDFRDFFDDVIYPLILFACTTAFAYLPVITYAILALAHVVPGFSVLAGKSAFALLLLLGSFAFPMAIMRVAGLYSLRGLNPVPIALSICRVPLQYFGLVLLLLIAIAVPLIGGFVLGAIPRVGVCFGMLLAPFFSLYAMLVEMRLTGVFVAKYQDRLRWTDLEPLQLER